MTQARFTEGSIMRHIFSMTSMASIGMMAMFIVDLLDMYFLSLLGEPELAAAVGYAGTVLFFTTSISIGVSIAMGALVSRSIGEDDIETAQSFLVNILVAGTLFSVVASVFIWFFIPDILSVLGATGKTHALGVSYLQILIPSMTILVMAMSLNGALKAVGDAKLSMWSTLAAGGVNAILDPIFIFGLDMGIEGAAYASVLARTSILVIAGYGVISKHKLLTSFDFSIFRQKLPAITSIAVPNILTNVATPIGSAYMLYTLSGFGDSVIAGNSIIGRVTPVAFAIVFALSGAVGPIFGQNFGAKIINRVRLTFYDAITFSCVYILCIALLLYLLQDWIISIFGVQQEGAEMIKIFCTWIALAFIFKSMIFIANAAFNNLGKPTWSTMINVGRSTLGTIPFVYFGAQWFGAPGVLYGEALGSVVFAVISFVMARKLIAGLPFEETVKDQQTSTENVETKNIDDGITIHTEHLDAACSSLARCTDFSVKQKSP
jgi:putative MATE family efflux protein